MAKPGAIKADKLSAGDLEQRVIIEQRAVAPDANYGSTVQTWSTFATVWAKIIDTVTIRRGGDEQIKRDTRVESGRTRITIRYMAGVDSTMRIRWPARSRMFQIVSIAETGRRDALDFECEQYSAEAYS